MLPIASKDLIQRAKRAYYRGNNPGRPILPDRGWDVIENNGRHFVVCCAHDKEEPAIKWRVRGNRLYRC